MNQLPKHWRELPQGGGRVLLTFPYFQVFLKSVSIVGRGEGERECPSEIELKEEGRESPILYCLATQKHSSCQAAGRQYVPFPHGKGSGQATGLLTSTSAIYPAQKRGPPSKAHSRWSHHLSTPPSNLGIPFHPSQGSIAGKQRTQQQQLVLPLRCTQLVLP